MDTPKLHTPEFVSAIPALTVGSSNEITEWCKQNCPSFAFNSVSWQGNNRLYLTFFFENEADAILCNLRWL